MVQHKEGNKGTKEKKSMFLIINWKYYAKRNRFDCVWEEGFVEFAWDVFFTRFLPFLEDIVVVSISIGVEVRDSKMFWEVRERFNCSSDDIGSSCCVFDVIIWWFVITKKKCDKKYKITVDASGSSFFPQTIWQELRWWIDVLYMCISISLIQMVI